MTLGGKRGNPKQDFPSSHPALEIAPRFPHSHRHDYGFILVQAINYTPLNCHPCCRAKSVTHVPGRTIGERFGLQPLRPQESHSG